MKKWLVGLMAAGLCAASAWAETVTYTVAGKAVSVTAGAEPDGASAVYEQTYNTSGQATAGNSMTLTLKGYDGATITGLTLRMHSNTSKGGGSLSATCGSDTIASIADKKFNDGWYNDWSKDFVDVTPAVTATTVGGDVVIKIEATENSLFIESYTIEYAMGDPEFSVTFDKENWFKVALGEASSVTAIPKYGIEPYTFLWESDTLELNGGTTDTLQIPDTLEEGDYTVACLVTEDNGEGDAINALIGFTVAAVPVITGDAFALVTSRDELQDGARYLVTDVTHSFAMSSAAVGSALSAVEVTESEGVITATDESTIWTLVEDSDGNFALQNGGKYVGWTSGNAATMQDAAFANKISVAEKVATITAVSDSTRNLKYNKSSPRFAYYTTAQTDLALFKEAGEAGLTVTLDKANGFTVDLGTADSIKAEAKNGTEPYSYVWTSDTAELNGTGDTLAIPATLAEGDYTVQVEVTDADSNKASKQIGFTVAAPLEPHAINIAVGIQNGTVTSDPEGEAVKGTQVKLTATATTEGYALKEMTVTYGETVLTFSTSPATFEMPDEAVSVGATFAEVKDYAELPFVAEDTPYSGPWKGATVDGLTSKGLGDDYKDGSAKLDSANDWIQVKFAGTPGTLSFGIKGNSLDEEKPSTFLVQESADGTEWSTLETYTTGDKLTGERLDQALELSATSQFVRFFYETKGAGNVGIYDVYISSGGPAVFSITLDPAKDFEVEQNAEAFVTAIPKHAAEGVVGYAWWIDGTPVDTAGEVLALATAELGPHKVICEATDAAGAKADAHVIYTVVAPAVKYAVNVAIGILNGGVTADKEQAEEGELVTLTASADAGYKLGTFLLDGEAITGNTFNMPAHDVLVSAEFVEKPVVAGFTKITSLAELTEGEYVITGAGSDGEYAMKASISTGSTKFLERREEAVTIEEDTVTDAEDIIIWTLAQGDNGWTIYNESVGYAGYVASGNSSGAEAEPSAKSTWTIAAGDTDGLFLLTNVGNTGRYLLYNASSPRFACYEKTTSGKQLALYKGASGPAVFSVTVDKKDGFEVPFGTADSITATAKNGSGDYSYAWTGDLTGEGATLEIPATLAAGDYAVTVTATDNGADGQTATKTVKFSVVEPAAKYPITVERVSGGVLSVEGDKTEAEAGEKVKVTATADSGMRLAEITVTGETTSLSFKSSPAEFEMPAEAVTVSATFEDRPVGAPFKKITSTDELEEGEYVITGAKAAGEEYAMKASLSTGSTKYIERRDDAVTIEGDTVTDAEDSIIWTLAKVEKGWTIYNETVGYAGYVASGNSSGFEAEASDKSTWTLTDNEGVFAVVNVGNDARQLLYNTGSPRFACYTNVSSGNRQLTLYKKAGEAKPSISYTGETTVKIPGSFELQFALKNYDGTVAWSLTAGKGSIDSASGIYTWKPTEAGTNSITVAATATGVEIAPKTVVLTVEAADPDQPAVECEDAPTGAVEAGKPLTLTFKASKFEVDPEGWYFEVDGEAVDPSAVTYSDDYQTATVTLTPEKSFTIKVSAYEKDFVSEVKYELSVTVGGEPGPVGGPYIKSIKVDSKAKTVTLTLADPTGKVRTTADLVAGEWTLNDKAATDGTLELPMGDSPTFYGAP